MKTRVTGVSMLDVQTLRARVVGAPQLRTASGRNPISPRYVEITYNITTGGVSEIIVVGNQTGRRMLVRRKVGEGVAPGWLLDLVSAHRPGVS